MKKMVAKKIFLILILLFNFYSLTYADTTPGKVNVIQTMINYDAKLRIGKIIKDSIEEDKKAGRKVDLKKIKSRIFTKPILTHFGIETAFTVTGSILQFILFHCAPPYGIAAGTLVSSFTAGMGGALGYEVSKNVEGNTVRSKGETLKKAISNIDATNFIARTLGSVIGAVVGQAICPFPFIGALIGGAVGSILAGKLTNLFVETKSGAKFAKTVQTHWNKAGEATGKFIDKLFPSASKNEKLNQNITISGEKAYIKKMYQESYRRYIQLQAKGVVSEEKLKQAKQNYLYWHGRFKAAGLK